MIAAHSLEYGKPCVLIEEGETPTAEAVIAFARRIGAVWYENDPAISAPDYIINVRHQFGPELWSERALRGSKLTGGKGGDVSPG